MSDEHRKPDVPEQVTEGMTVSSNNEARFATQLPARNAARKSLRLLAAAVVLLVLIFLVVPNLLSRGGSQEEAAPPQQEVPETISVQPRQDFGVDADSEETTVAEPDTRKEDDDDDGPVVISAAPAAPATQAAPAPQRSSEPALIKGKGNFHVVGGSASSGSTPPVPAARARTGTDDEVLKALKELQQPANTAADKNKDPFTAPAFEPTEAAVSPYDRHLLLSKGTIIQCVLSTKLVTNVSGQISCVVADDVYSESGSVVLIEKGSQVNGFYKSEAAEHGSNEIFAVWQEIRTPNNIVISLNSGSADEVGASGLRGWADHHFWERLKNAVVVSLIRDVSDRATNSVSGSQVVVSGGSGNLAEQLVGSDNDIKPTIYKNQGDKLSIFVARDIDFSTVYQLRLKH